MENIFYEFMEMKFSRGETTRIFGDGSPHKDSASNQRQVDQIVRTEKTERFYEYVDKLKLQGNTAYRLLIELDRSKRREKTRFTADTCDKLAEALSKISFWGLKETRPE
jgi:hypothetical protein